MEARDARRQPEARLYMGDYPFDLSPSEFVRRNVRITPLPRLHQSPDRAAREVPRVRRVLHRLHHNEGTANPTAYYRDHLRGVDEALVKRFMGANLAESYSRMGDPL